jgi:hypothetical protein
MQSGSNFVVLMTLGCVAAWLISTWIRAKYGYPIDDGAGNAVHKVDQSRDDVSRAMEAALANRDQRIAALEKRVVILERIATDRRSMLEEEIEALRA